MNQCRFLAVLLAALFAAALAGCGDKSVVEIPALPDFDSSTEEAVVNTIKEHHAKLAEDPSFDNLREYGKVLQAHRRDKLAVAVYDQCLEMKEDFECLYLAGRILKRNEPEKALVYLEKAEKIRNDYAPLYLDFGECFELKGEHDKAIEAVRKSIEMESSALGQFLLGRNLLAARKAAESISHLERANSESPGQKSIMNLLVRAYGETNQPEKAEAMTRALASAPENKSAIASNNLIMRSVILKGRSYQSMLTRAVGALTAGRYDVALDAINERIKFKPEEAGNHALLGDAYHGLKRYSEAVKSLQKAKELDSENALIRLKLSKSLVMVGQTQDAFKEVVKARQLDPKDAEARLYYAYHIWQKDPKKAERELGVAIRLDPSHLEAKTLLAKILFVMKRPAEARQQIKEILELSPGNSRAINLRDEYRDM